MKTTAKAGWARAGVSAGGAGAGVGVTGGARVGWPGQRGETHAGTQGLADGSDPLRERTPWTVLGMEMTLPLTVSGPPRRWVGVFCTATVTQAGRSGSFKPYQHEKYRKS